MRSRYSAYAVGQVDYIVETHDPRTIDELDRSSAEHWARNSTWKDLQVLSVLRGGEDDSDGEVEFVARFDFEDEEQTHHETARFRKREGRWYFVRGRVHAEDTFSHGKVKVGRNDPCSCGSGKKSKKCCGG